MEEINGFAEESSVKSQEPGGIAEESSVKSQEPGGLAEESSVKSQEPSEEDIIYELPESSENSEVSESSENADPAENQLKKMIAEVGAETLLDIIRDNRNAAIRQIISEVEASQDRTVPSGLSGAHRCNSIFDLAALA